jgi:hypothetical protein
MAFPPFAKTDQKSARPRKNSRLQERHVVDYKRSQQHKFSHYHTMKNQMRNTAKSVVMSLARDVPGVKEYDKASRVVNTAVNLANAKDPLDALSAVFKQVPGAKECIKAINYAYNPSKIVLDIGKKALSMGLSAGSL